MITVFEVQDLFYKTLSEVPGKFGITGGIYKGQRPDGSLKEDIVINCLPMSGYSVQTCIVNVNIHVQDLKLDVDSVTQSVPNYKRMKEIGDQVFNLLKLKYGSDYVIYLENQQDLRDTNNSHFYNLRLRFRKINS